MRVHVKGAAMGLSFSLGSLPPDAPTAEEIAAIEALQATCVDERALRRAWRQAGKARARLELSGRLVWEGVPIAVLVSLTTEEMESAWLTLQEGAVMDPWEVR